MAAETIPGGQPALSKETAENSDGKPLCYVGDLVIQGTVSDRAMGEVGLVARPALGDIR
jgi:hypothetical protein